MRESERSTSYSIETRSIHSECGLFGVFSEEGNVYEMLYKAGADLQHRAEGAAGMYVSDGIEFDHKKGLGMVSGVFEEGNNFPDLKNPRIGIIHTRYPTAGSSKHTPNIQPFEVNETVMAHHGNLTNTRELRERLGPIPFGGEYPNSDSWLAVNALIRADGNSLEEKMVNVQKEFEGGWAFIAMDGKKLVAARDPYGIRPLSVGWSENKSGSKNYFISVETAPFNDLKVHNFREVLPGETIKIDNEGIQTVDLNPKGEKSCIFEFVYMMRPDSTFMGEVVHTTRVRAGENLWKESPLEIDKDEEFYVMGVPNSGRPSGSGYYRSALTSGYNAVYKEGLIANPYYGRNFIKSTGDREAALKFKYIPEIYKGKKVVIVDDSLVRGDTMQGLVQKCRSAGAEEIHVRIASPEINNPCYWGVAFSNKEELITSKIPDLKERADFLGVDSLAYLSMDGLYNAVGVSEEEMCRMKMNNERKHCTYCFDGNGPLMRENEIIPLSELK